MKTTKNNGLLLSGMIILFIGSFFISCNRDLNYDEIAPTIDSSLAEGTLSQFARGSGESAIDTVYVVDETRNAMISFTNGIKAYYEEGMSYSDLKYALDPADSLVDITTKGDALLFEAYSNIANNVSEEDVDGIKITEALQFILQNSLDQGYTNTKEVDFESGSKILFGLDANYGLAAKGGCKWYQIGCHLSNLWNWLTADANGDAPGTTTNGSALSTAIGIVSGIISIIGAIGK